MRGELEGRKVLQVATVTGGDYTVTADGSVFACSRNSSGQLGVGSTEGSLVPTLVTGQLQGNAAVYAAASDNLALCITADGAAITGQLDVGDTAHRLATGLQGKQGAHIAVGSFHTIYTTTDGSRLCVYLWLNWFKNRDRLALG